MFFCHAKNFGEKLKTCFECVTFCHGMLTDFINIFLCFVMKTIEYLMRFEICWKKRKCCIDKICKQSAKNHKTYTVRKKNTTSHDIQYFLDFLLRTSDVTLQYQWLANWPVKQCN